MSYLNLVHFQESFNQNGDDDFHNPIDVCEVFCYITLQLQGEQVDYKEFKSIDRSLPPIVIKAENGTTFMSACNEVVQNLRSKLAAIYIDESKRYHTFNEYWQRTHTMIGKAIVSNFRFPTILMTRNDFKAVIAYGVYQAYVLCYATQDYLSSKRMYGKTMNTECINTSITRVLQDCKQMITLNSMENR